jgi:RimJ/RimL family protein N-acetyltransferase
VGLRIRRAESEDLSSLLQLEADPEAARWIISWSRHRHEQALAAPDEATIVIEDERRLVGFALLAALGNESGSVELRRIVVAPRGSGVGRRALRLVLDLAFDEIGAHRVWLDLRVDNHRARRAYQAVGFVHEGTLRDAMRSNGRYESLAVMSILEDERPEGAAASPRRQSKGEPSGNPPVPAHRPRCAPPTSGGR